MVVGNVEGLREACVWLLRLHTCASFRKLVTLAICVRSLQNAHCTSRSCSTPRKISTKFRTHRLHTLRKGAKGAAYRERDVRDGTAVQKMKRRTRHCVVFVGVPCCAEVHGLKRENGLLRTMCNTVQPHKLPHVIHRRGTGLWSYLHKVGATTSEVTL